MTAVSAFVSILGFMVVFRSNQAWSRYWEGADLVQQARGEWISATSSLFACMSRSPEKADQVVRLEGLVVRLMSLLYAESLSCLSEGHGFELLDLEGIEQTAMDMLDDQGDNDSKLEMILHWVQRVIIDNISSGTITAPPPIVSRVFNELSAGVVKIASARKIKDIQFPFHYAQMLGISLLVYTAGVPIMSAYLFTTYWAAGASSFLNIFVLWCVNYLSVEIEQPFGTDPNDLPLQDEMRYMNETLAMLLSTHAKKPPTFSPPTNREPWAVKSCVRLASGAKKLGSLMAASDAFADNRGGGRADGRAIGCVSGVDVPSAWAEPTCDRGAANEPDSEGHPTAFVLPVSALDWASAATGDRVSPQGGLGSCLPRAQASDAFADNRGG
eukprot:CAMPEP_0198517216 /NCGR_PEP_ID=MMETSP1462-20131121/18398_1 /TAXON_ID=1333877 /ORGANISM="Brandtodinium nutriculum, Strain RCC3387" /LENGTH=384 /DNA_ID=CAMNT_0044246769 /DNA_START=162 /DNA_END=1312 /DNA_ORIENTATION=+